MIPEKTVERLIIYRRLLKSTLSAESINVENAHVFSHQIARASGYTSAQVRRDLMCIGYSGSPAHGYSVDSLAKAIESALNIRDRQNVILVGVGQLGRAIIDYFRGRCSSLEIVAAFDTDSDLTNRVFHGVRCFHINELLSVSTEIQSKTAIITVPAEVAQEVTNKLVEAGITGILNYAPVSLIVPPHVYLENRDMITALMKVAYFAENKK